MGSYNFGWDIHEGEIGEEIVRELLSGKPGMVEVKRDTIVSATGNIAVEYECRGRPSGIMVSTATWWAFVLSGKDFQDEIVIVILTERLRALCDYHIQKRETEPGGDDGQSQMVLLHVPRLLRWNPSLLRGTKGRLLAKAAGG